MLKKYKEALDKHKYTSVLYTDVSELFYSVKYSLLFSSPTVSHKLFNVVYVLEL